MKKTTKIIYLMLLFASSVGAEELNVNGISYELDDASLTAKVIALPSGLPSNQLPEYVNANRHRYRVTSIGSYAAKTYKGQRIVIPNSVETIEDNAFTNSQLESVTIGIGDFYVLPGVKKIGSKAFDCSKLRSVNLMTSEVPQAAEDAFGNRESKLSLSVHPTMEEAFKNATDCPWSLFSDDNIYVVKRSRQNQNTFTAEDLWKFNFDFFADGMAYNILSRDEKTVETTYLCPSETYADRWVYEADTLRVPATVEYHDTIWNVKAVGSGTFCLSENIRRVEIAEGVTEIGSKAFAYMVRGMNEVVIPSSMKKIGDYAFAGDIMNVAYGPNKVLFPDTDIELGVGVFSWHDDEEMVALPASMTEVPDMTFYKGGLYEWKGLPEQIEVIGEKAFSYNSFEEVLLPKNLKEIRAYAFGGCVGLKTVTIPASVTLIGESAFGGSADWNFEGENELDCYLDTMIVLATTPPVNTTPLTKTVLIVPDGTKQAYLDAWIISSPVLEMSEATAIRSIRTTQNERIMYDMRGHRLIDTPNRGVYIENGRKRVGKS